MKKTKQPVPSTNRKYIGRDPLEVVKKTMPNTGRKGK